MAVLQNKLAEMWKDDDGRPRSGRERRAFEVAQGIVSAIDVERRKYADIERQGRNPAEYGQRGVAQVIADELVRRKLI